MDLKAFEALTKDEKVDFLFLVQERINQLKAIEEQTVQAQAARERASAIAVYEAESLVAIEAVRVQRYKGKLALVESFNPKPVIEVIEEPIEDMKP